MPVGLNRLVVAYLRFALGYDSTRDAKTLVDTTTMTINGLGTQVPTNQLLWPQDWALMTLFQPRSRVHPSWSCASLTLLILYTDILLALLPDRRLGCMLDWMRVGPSPFTPYSLVSGHSPCSYKDPSSRISVSVPVLDSSVPLHHPFRLFTFSLHPCSTRDQTHSLVRIRLHLDLLWSLT